MNKMKKCCEKNHGYGFGNYPTIAPQHNGECKAFRSMLLLRNHPAQAFARNCIPHPNAEFSRRQIAGHCTTVQRSATVPATFFGGAK
jgi:hypothetical protein